MLANRLNILLAERQLTNKQVVEETGLSRNSISNIANNPEANIATETIDKLCNYLDVTPAEFFLYSPYTISLFEEPENPSAIYITVLHNHQEFMYIYDAYAKNNDYGNEDRTRRKNYDLYLEFESESDVSGMSGFADIYKQLPIGFQTQLNAQFNKEIEKKLSGKSVPMVTWFNGSPEKNTDKIEKISFTEFCKRQKNKKISVSLRFPWKDVNKIFDINKMEFI